MRAFRTSGWLSWVRKAWYVLPTDRRALEKTQRTFQCRLLGNPVSRYSLMHRTARPAATDGRTQFMATLQVTTTSRKSFVPDIIGPKPALLTPKSPPSENSPRRRMTLPCRG